MITKTQAGVAAALMLAASAAQAQYSKMNPVSVRASANDGNLPANAVDNNLSTRWSANGDGQWLELDLGSTRTIGYVAVALYNGNVRQSRFDIQVSTSGSSWTTVWSGSSSGTSNNLQTFDFSDASGRWVRYLGHGNTVNAWNSVTEIAVYATGSTNPTPRPTARPRPTPTPSGTWKKANLTNFTSYPDPGSSECVNYNGCLWAGQFAFVSGKQSESWVQSHNIIAITSRTPPPTS
jgi:hypothetical protein